MSTHPDLLTWLADLGVAPLITALTGGASPRTFWRLRDSSPPRLVMVTPDTGPTEHGASATNRWVTMQRYLADLALPVPAIHAASPGDRFLLIDDLGDERLYERATSSPASRLALYEQALDLLASFQRLTSASPPTFAVPTFTADHLRAELAEFADMALEARLGVTLTPAERLLLTTVADSLAAALTPDLLAHRDFQSQNLMLTPAGLVLIDFQDAFFAPRVYDLVALLRDSYIRLTPAELDHLLAHFATLSDQPLDSLRDAFHLQTIQRKLKDSGRFETLARRGKPHFLAFFADSIAYVVDALVASKRFPDLLDLLLTHLPEARAAITSQAATSAPTP